MGAPELAAVKLYSELEKDRRRELPQGLPPANVPVPVPEAPAPEAPAPNAAEAALEEPSAQTMAPSVQTMERPSGASAEVATAIESLGASITMRLAHANFAIGDAYTKRVSGTLQIATVRGSENLVIHFASDDRTKGHLAVDSKSA